MTRRTVSCCAAIALAALVLVPAISTAGDDSPWPERGSEAAEIRAVRDVVRRLEERVELMELAAARYAGWETCIRAVPVSEYGDTDRRFGYVFDDGDGTPRSHMPALRVDRGRAAGRADYRFLAFDRDSACESSAPVPGGTADPAAVPVAASAGREPTLTSLERRVRRLQRAVRRLDAASERFDAWASCVSWVPVTEYGDPDRRFGYVFERDGAGAGYRPAIAIDRSDWDDPDYMLLAFVGGDRPGGDCQDEPGEAVD